MGKMQGEFESSLDSTSFHILDKRRDPFRHFFHHCAYIFR